MFRVVPKAPLLAEAGLLALCPSLNSPVLNSEDLPVGPARAAILVCAEEYGGLSVSVAVRSIATGDVQAYIYRGKPDDLASPNQAIDLALTFAEGMGFLFDDDWVPQQGKAAALDLWTEITAGQGVAASPQVEPELELDELEICEENPLDLDPAPLPERDAASLELPACLELNESPHLGDSTLLLDDVAAPELDQPVAEGEEPRLAEPASADFEVAESDVDSGAARAQPTLTKFRRPPEKKSKPRTKLGSPPAKDAAVTGSELGRIALVRKRLGGGPEPAQKRSLLMRLLGQF